MKPRRPAVVLVPSDRVALVYDSTGWHLVHVPPAWWIEEREAELEADAAAFAAQRAAERRERAAQRARVRYHQRRREELTA